MAKLWLAWILVLALLVGVASHVGAVTLAFSPNTQSVPYGLSASVDLVVSGLGDSGAPSLGAFDFDVSCDANLIAPLSVTFGSGLGDFDLGEADQGYLVNLGVVNLFGLSLLTPEELDALQSADSFTLATITFYTIAEGVSPLAYSNVVLGDGLGDPLALDASPDGSIVVPEPAALVLLWLTLAGLTARRLRCADDRTRARARAVRH